MVHRRAGTAKEEWIVVRCKAANYGYSLADYVECTTRFPPHQPACVVVKWTNWITVVESGPRMYDSIRAPSRYASCHDAAQRAQFPTYRLKHVAGRVPNRDLGTSAVLMT